MGKQKKSNSFILLEKNKLYLLEIDFSVVRMSRSLVMISLLLSFVSYVLLLFFGWKYFLVFLEYGTDLRKKRKKELIKQKKFRFFEIQKKKIKKILVTWKKKKKKKMMKKKKQETRNKKKKTFNTTENWRMYCMHPTLPSL